MKEFTKDKLKVRIFGTRGEMGEAAAADVCACIKKLLSEKDEINMIFAAAPSQDDLLSSLVKKDIEWGRINAFHMDEYLGLPEGAEQSFGSYLKEHIFGLVKFRSVNYINASAEDKEAECARYSALLEKYPVDVVCLGIGENGHIAFNDPHIARFDDEKRVKIADLDEKCRMQQVHDGCFAKFDDVPEYALTLTVPSLTRARYMFCVVPTDKKAEAVRTT
ncbi:MAG: 6-phosphogluconolactonase, partial [Clostridia bacterium]|nr:6-phosphogluconolactonase [Clostridia bacterium]